MTKKYAQILLRRLTDNIEVTVLMCFGVLLGFFTLTYSQNEDMGIFLSEFSLISNGHRVYSGIMEIKDPLFLWFGGISTWFFGSRAPYLFDAFFVMISPVVAYGFARSCKASKTWSIVSAVFFAGSLSGTYFQSLRTGTVALVVIVCSLWAAQKNRWMLCGVLCVLVIGLKMAYAPALLGIAALIIGKNLAKRLLPCLVGVIATSSSMFLMLWIRGELSGYIFMVKTNFMYRKSYPEIIGFPTGVSGHIQVINSFSSSFNMLMIIFLAVSLATFVMLRNGLKDKIAIGLCLTSLGCIAVLLSSAMWIHHLQILSLVSISISVISGLYAETLGKNSSSLDRLIGALVIVMLFVSLNVTGWKVPARPQTPISQWLRPHWVEPGEITFLKSSNIDLKYELNFARLGPNDDLGLGAFLTNEWRLVCRDYGQYGHETQEMVNEIIECLVNKPNYLFISPGFLALERVSGTYSSLKSRTSTALKKNFECLDIEQRPGAKFCTRIIFRN
jgi:hypothetical protein